MKNIKFYFDNSFRGRDYRFYLTPTIFLRRMETFKVKPRHMYELNMFWLFWEFTVVINKI